MDPLTIGTSVLGSKIGTFLGNGIRSVFSSQPVTQTTTNSSTTQQAVPTPSVQTSSSTGTPSYQVTPQNYQSTGNPFSIDTSNLTSDHLAGDATPSSVLNYRNQLQDQYNQYLTAQQPLQQQLAQQILFSPQELQAQQDLIKQNQNYRQLQQNVLAGTNNIYGRNEPLEFQQGQQAALQRQASILEGNSALGVQAASENLNYLQNLRQNQVAATTAMLNQNQQNYQNQFGATREGQSNAVALQQLGLGRYEYQQITDPNTGFPTIQVIDKTTGLPAGTVAPGTPTAQAIQQSGLVGGGNLTSNPVVASTMSLIGATNDMPVATAIQTFGLPKIVDAFIGQEGGSPQGVINNPGNVKSATAKSLGIPYTDSGVQATDGGTFASFPTMQAGKQAVGQWVQAHANSNLSGAIASYKGVNAGSASNAANPSSNDQAYQNIINSAPVTIKNAIKQLPDGTPYIDGGQLNNPAAEMAANAYSGHTGVRLISADDAKAIDSAKQAISNLGAQAALFGQLAPSSALGSLGANFADPIKQWFDTGKGSLLKTYNSNRDSLLQQIRTLAGSSPRLNANELNLAANSMPTLNEFSKNTLKDGINKLVLTQSYLDNAIRSLDPNYIGTPVNIGGQYAIMGPDGTAYQFQTRDAAIQALQVKNQTK